MSKQRTPIAPGEHVHHTATASSTASRRPNISQTVGDRTPTRFARTALIPMMCGACTSRNEHELRAAEVNTNAAPLPPELDRAIMRLVRAMARDAARQDHERERNEASSNIRPVLHGSAK